MKQTSITKLSEVYNNLNALYNGEQIPHDYKSLANLIQEVIRAEAITKPKGSKFDIYNYTSKDTFRMQMCGVFHDNGVLVASDAHIMVAINGDYPAEYEGRVILKDGSINAVEVSERDPETKRSVTVKHETAWTDKDGREHSVYPNWRSIIPFHSDYKPIEVDAEKFYAAIEELRTQWKTETGKGTKFQDLWRVKVGDALLKAEFFDKMLTAIKELGTTQVWVRDGRRAVVAKSDKGTVLLMPVMPGCIKDEHIIELV